jgi:hypothetical protein
MKITSAKTLMAWCKQAPKVRERIVWDELPDNQKDSAVVAFQLDLGTPHAITIANRLNLKTCAQNVKESALRNTEYELQYLVRQYNDMLDLQDAELSTEREQSYCKKTFNSIFGVNQSMFDAGHKPSDFC